MRDFLECKGLDTKELKHLFAKERINMSRLAVMTHSWICHHISEESFGSDDYVQLRQELYKAILELRKEIACEMEMKLQEEYQEYEREQRRLAELRHSDSMNGWNGGNGGDNSMSFLNVVMQKNRRNKNSLVYRFASKLDSFVSDPLYLISVGFGILILFTFVLFIVVGHAPTATQAK